MIIAEHPDTGLQIHELAHQGADLLPACLEVFAEQFPEYAAEPVNIDELRTAAEAPWDPTALFQPHLWLITVQGHPAGMAFFLYNRRRSIGLLLFIAIRVDYRKAAPSGVSRLSDWVLEYMLHQIRLDGETAGLPALGLAAEVDYPHLMARYEQMGMQAIDAAYAEPLAGMTASMVGVEALEQINFHPLLLGVFPLSTAGELTTSQMGEVVLTFLQDYYELPLEHWAVQRSLDSLHLAIPQPASIDLAVERGELMSGETMQEVTVRVVDLLRTPSAGDVAELMDLFDELFPQYAPIPYVVNELQRITWEPADSIPPFIRHLWLVKVNEQPAGMTYFCYHTQRNLAIGVYLAVRPEFRRLVINGHQRLAEYLITQTHQAIAADARCLDQPIPPGYIAEVDVSRLLQQYRQYGFILLPVSYHEPRLPDGCTTSLPPGSLNYHPINLGFFPRNPQSFDELPSRAMIRSGLLSFLVDFYGIPADHWSVQQALQSIPADLPE